MEVEASRIETLTDLRGVKTWGPVQGFRICSEARSC